MDTIKALLFFTITLLLAACSNQSKEKPVFKSQVDYYNDFTSKHVAKRNVEVFLPRQYFEDSTQRFDVLIMHDGQNVFNAETAYGGIAWEVDSTVQALMDSNMIKPIIVVGVWNTRRRYEEYCPEKPFKALGQEQQDSLYRQYKLEKEMLADEYLSFLTSELYPFIKDNYRVNVGPNHTRIMGSSMGGLISCYALLEYPNVFGGAGCISTHWPFVHEPGNHPFSAAMQHYIAERISSVANNHLLYCDYGTATLDSLYEPHQLKVDSIVLNSSFNPGNYMSRRFEGAAHNESSWKKRLHIPLEFLFGKEN